MNKQEIKQSGQQVFKQKLKQEVIIPLWKDILKKSIVNEEQLCAIFKDKVSISAEDIEKVVKKYPMSINPYYLSLIKKQDDAIWNQCIPDIKEIEDDFGMEDQLHEETDSPVPGLTHRYPDRVLLLVSNQCATYCRFCTRKRKVGDPFKRITKDQIMKGIEYIKEHGYKLFLEKRPGLRYALVEAIENTDCDVIITFSPDGNCVPEVMPELIAKMKRGYDMVIASRYAEGAKSYDDSLITAFGNWMFTRVVNILHGGKYTDVMNIYRAYKKSLVKEKTEKK